MPCRYSPMRSSLRDNTYGRETILRHERISDAMEAIKKANDDALVRVGPLYDIRLGTCASYTALLRGEHGSEVTVGDLRSVVVQQGRTLVSARGGAGKTVILRRLLKRTFDCGELGAFLQLRGWDQTASQQAGQLGDSDVSLFDLLLRTFSEPPLDLATLDSASPYVTKLVLVDGLNEVPGEFANRILAACDAAARIFPGLSVVVTDRLVRRSLADESQWQYLTVLPLQAEEVQRWFSEDGLPAGTAELLSTPFFLDSAKRGELKASPEATMKGMFTGHASLLPDEITKMAGQAFCVYSKDRSRTFREGFLDPAIEARLSQAGLLLAVGPGRVAFRHHLLHDWLASVHVAEHPRLWAGQFRHHTFDALTFGGNSFDAVAFALQVLFNRADMLGTGSFLRAVYDWNPYAAGYALSDVEAASDIIVPAGLRAIILFMLGMRRFDLFANTRQRATDALDLFRDDLSRKILFANSMSRLVELAADANILEPDYQSWCTVFSISEEEAMRRDTVAQLAGKDDVVAWTLANVLKRYPYTVEVEAALVALAGSQEFVVRWRSVHAMGAGSGRELVDTLLDRLKDPAEHRLVRAGAARSLVEVAAATPAETRLIVTELVAALDVIEDDKHVLDGLVGAAFVAPCASPAGWAQSFAPVFHALIDRSHSAEEVSRWSSMASDLRMQNRATA
jgi:hypothetical protein